MVTISPSVRDSALFSDGEHFSFTSSLFSLASQSPPGTIWLFCNQQPPRHSPLCGPLDGLIDPLIGTSNESNCFNHIGRWFPSIISSLSTGPALPSRCLCGHKMTNSQLADMLSILLGSHLTSRWHVCFHVLALTALTHIHVCAV